MVLWQVDNDSDCLKRVCFSDKATFHISGKVVHCNFRIWGSQNSHGVREHEWGSLKLNMQCGLICAGVIRPFFFHKVTVVGAVCLDVLCHRYLTAASVSKWATTTFLACVTEFLNEQFTGIWTGQGDPSLWPPRLPYLTPPWLFYMGISQKRMLD